MQLSSYIARKNLPPRPPLKVVKILQVEDCKSDVVLVERMLEEVSVGCFYEITDVPRLVDAFYKMDKENFDLVLLDLNLLDIDGVAAVAAVRAQAPHIPIVVYSGTNDAQTKEKALMCGAQHYLVKGRESGFGLKYIIEHAIA
jgi:CheY-like chemotaxis protein